MFQNCQVLVILSKERHTSKSTSWQSLMKCPLYFNDRKLHLLMCFHVTYFYASRYEPVTYLNSGSSTLFSGPHVSLVRTRVSHSRDLHGGGGRPMGMGRRMEKATLGIWRVWRIWRIWRLGQTVWHDGRMLVNQLFSLQPVTLTFLN